MALDISGAFAPARLADHCNHQPTGQRWWRECALFMLCDAANGVIGYYQIGQHPHLGHSNVYYWTSAQTLGLSDRQFAEALPLIDHDVADATLGELSFETIRPMDEYRLAVTRENYRMEVAFKPLFWPIEVASSVKGASFAAGHYNAVGRATGFVETADGRVGIDAYGYMDRCWGEQKAHFPASKWIFAGFDDETFVQCFPVLSLDGSSKHLLGYVAADGKLRKLTDDYDTGWGLRDDWLTASGCDFRTVDEDGRRFRFTGQTQGPGNVYPFIHGKFCVHALASFDFDGRPGRGLLENSLPRAIPPVWHDLYGLDPHGTFMTMPD